MAQAKKLLSLIESVADAPLSIFEYRTVGNNDGGFSLESPTWGIVIYDAYYTTYAVLYYDISLKGKRGKRITRWSAQFAYGNDKSSRLAHERNLYELLKKQQSKLKTGDDVKAVVLSFFEEQRQQMDKNGVYAYVTEYTAELKAMDSSIPERADVVALLKDGLNGKHVSIVFDAKRNTISIYDDQELQYDQRRFIEVDWRHKDKLFGNLGRELIKQDGLGKVSDMLKAKKVKFEFFNYFL